jgi:hypothetical protein
MSVGLLSYIGFIIFQICSLILVMVVLRSTFSILNKYQDLFMVNQKWIKLTKYSYFAIISFISGLGIYVVISYLFA